MSRPTRPWGRWDIDSSTPLSIHLVTEGKEGTFGECLVRNAWAGAPLSLSGAEGHIGGWGFRTAIRTCLFCYGPWINVFAGHITFSHGQPVSSVLLLLGKASALACLCVCVSVSL